MKAFNNHTCTLDFIANTYSLSDWDCSLCEIILRCNNCLGSNTDETKGKVFVSDVCPVVMTIYMKASCLQIISRKACQGCQSPSLNKHVNDTWHPRLCCRQRTNMLLQKNWWKNSWKGKGKVWIFENNLTCPLRDYNHFYCL